MKNKLTLILLIIFINITSINYISANEFIFDTSEIKISDNGNIIDAIDGLVTSKNDNIKIVADKFQYNKNLSILKVNDGIVTSSDDNIEIIANKFQYNQNLSFMTATGDVIVKSLTKKIIFKSQNVLYNIKERIIISETESSINDALGNLFLMKGFTYTLNDNLVKIDDAKIVDIEKNRYYIKKAFINVDSNKLIGKDVSINFNNKSFNKENEPRIKGESISADGNISQIEGATFTTCKKRDECPPWELKAKEIKHDKEKKTIFYKDAWLKLYDKPVFYFPKFFHPDPTVKRQSGFLIPSFGDSNTLGLSLNIPYYKVLAENKDFTLRPRFYSNEKVLLQSEYRQVDEKSNHIVDLSLVNENNLSAKSHFFSKSKKKLNFNNFDEAELNLNLQQVSNDTYLKVYKLKSPLINDSSQNLLTSSLGINAYREDLTFDVEVQVFEDLSKEDSDRYEFILPYYNLTKELGPSNKLSGNYSVDSSGYIKNYSTNVFEKVLINNLNFNSDSKYTTSGFKNNYNFLIKNINTNGSNSEKYTNNSDYKLESIFEYNSSYPLKKELENYTNILKPIVSFKYSPNKNKNMKDIDRRIDINNIYSLNRIATNEAVEGGASVTFGTEFSKTNKLDKEVFAAKLANVLRVDENENLPNTSKLGKKTSDIVGYLNFDPNNVLKLTYDFSLDENLKDTNYQLLSSQFEVNNFITTFEYLNENKTGNKESYLSNKTTYNLNNSSNLMFGTRRNKKTKLTEFHNLIYQYRNDCLVAALEYNKEYYNDRDLKPEENIFIKLTIIPFGQTSSPNLKR